MPASKSGKLPPIIPLTDLLRMKRFPSQAPIVFLTNAQWRTWNRKLAAATRKTPKTALRKAKSKPKVSLDVTPVPALKGYLLRIVPLSPRAKISVWRPKEFPLCLSIGIKPSGKLRFGLTCGMYFNICTRQITCAGTCPILKPPRGIPPFRRMRCVPVYRTIPETRYIASCLCIPLP